MRIGTSRDLPGERLADYQRARRLSVTTIIFVSFGVVLVYLTLGASQAMKAAWVEDLVSLVPPISFLIAGEFAHRPADKKHPYGFHRSVNIAYLFSSIVLLGMGLYILIESGLTLIQQDHPSIGSIDILGHTVWLGWLMMIVLAATVAPAFILGRLQIPLAQRLHDKALFANAKMLKADWSTAVAGIAGIVGIAFGLWWADAAAAILISLSIASDGWTNSRVAVRELSDGEPTIVDGSAVDPLRARLETELAGMSWIEEANVRVRSEGHTFFADAYVVPTGPAGSEQVESTVAYLKGLDWRLHEVSVTPVGRIELGFDAS